MMETASVVDADPAGSTWRTLTLEDTVVRAGTGGATGAGLTTMGGRGGNYADPARAILNNDSHHLLSPPWRI